MSGMAHFFMSVGGSKIHERLAHFFIDIYTLITQKVTYILIKSRMKAVYSELP